MHIFPSKLSSREGLSIKTVAIKKPETENNSYIFQLRDLTKK
jgi:hypothetical protein